MLPINSQIDPIVEILRLAYRRGLAIREKLAEQNAKSTNAGKDKEEQTASTDSNRTESSLDR